LPDDVGQGRFGAATGKIAVTITAVRGSKSIEEQDFLVYLASLLRLENVGVLLGAGASCPSGGKTMAQMWAAFVAKSRDDAEWLVSQGFLPADAVPKKAAAASAVVMPTTPNIEALVDSLEIAVVEWKRTKNDPMSKQGAAVRRSLLRSLIKAALLEEDWWKSSLGPIAPDELKHHRSVLQKLTAAREPGQSPPWVFTTNYDLAVEWAAESVDIQVSNGFVGLHARRFSPQSFDIGFRNTQARGEARFGVYNIYLAKLHGSLTWQQVREELYEVPAAQAWNDLSEFLTDTTTDLSYLVLPRAAKYLETVGYTLGELLRRFSEFMSRPQTALVVAGYGFGDEHVNRLLRSALLNPTLQVVIYMPEFTGNPSDPKVPEAVRELLSFASPRVTVVGGGSEAYFDRFDAHLPDPTVFDDDLAQLKKKMFPPSPPPPPASASGGPTP
jgi:hypothetical protein